MPNTGALCLDGTVEPRYNEVLGTMKITLLYQVSHYIRVKKQRNIKRWDQQNYLVIRGFCYIRPLYNEFPLYSLSANVLDVQIIFSQHCIFNISVGVQLADFLWQMDSRRNLGGTCITKECFFLYNYINEISNSVHHNVMIFHCSDLFFFWFWYVMNWWHGLKTIKAIV